VNSRALSDASGVNWNQPLIYTIEINFSINQIIWIYPIYVIHWYMDLSRKSKDLNRTKSQRISVNLSGSSHHSIIGEFTNSPKFVDSPLSKERKQMKIKVSQSEYTDSLWRIENTIRETCANFNITDKPAIDEQVAIAVKEYEENHEVKGGTHQDCVKGEARVHLKEVLLPALKIYNEFTIEQGLHGKGNCELETVNLNYKALKSETTDETSDDDNEKTEPVETEENEKTK